MARAKKLLTQEDKSALHEAFCSVTGYRVPRHYFLGADCYGIRNLEGAFVGGFVLRKGHISTLRSYQEIPNLSRPYISINSRAKEYTDITGYFLTDKRYGLRLTWCFVKTVLLYPSSSFIYSYSCADTRLGRYYSYGHPKLIYSGLPALVEGYTEQQPEVNVEMLSKWGIVKIFINRCKKYLAPKK